MSEWEQKTKRDNELEDIKHRVLMKEEQQKLDHLERLEEDKISGRQKVPRNGLVKIKLFSFK